MVKAIISMQIAAYLLKKAQKIEMPFFNCNTCNICNNDDYKQDFYVTGQSIEPVTPVTNHPKPSICLVKTYQTLLFNSFILVDAVAVRGNNDRLSNTSSVTPLRHSGFFASVIYAASQASKNSAKMTMAHLRPKSVYDWMTRPNKPMANKSGGTRWPRVNPVALISQLSATSNNSKHLGMTQ